MPLSLPLDQLAPAQTPRQQRRFVRVGFAAEFLSALVRPTTGMDWGLEVGDGLPSDAAEEGMYFDGAAQILYVTFSHPSFAPVPLGGLPPEVFLTYRRHYPTGS